MKHAGKIILDRITDLGITKAEFGRRIGINQRQNVQRIFEKEEFTLPELKHFGEVLGIDLVAEIYPEDYLGNKAEEDEGNYRPKLMPSITVQLDGSREQLRKTIKMLEKMNEVVRTSAL